MVKNKKKPGLISNSSLILISFAVTFFPRIIDAAGAPAAINFAHFAVLPICCIIVIATTPVRNRQQINLVQLILFGLLVFLAEMMASALLNGAGFINVILAFLLLAEPFLFLLTLICIPILSPEKLEKFKLWIVSFAAIHIGLAFCQKILLTLGILKRTDMTEADNVQGVFYLSGGGHVVAASVSLSFGLYFWLTFKKAPLWLRIAFLSAGFTHVIFADAKQVLVVWFMAWFLLIAFKLNNIKTTINYLCLAAIAALALFWCIENVEAFRAFKTWIRPGYYGPDGLATQLKISGIKIIASYYETPLHWLLGLGPGHTVGRLGGWILSKYGSLFAPLGATTHPVSNEVFDYWRSTWLDSSFFSPLFGWAGIWGNFGFLGLGIYSYLCYLVWHKLCVDDFSKFMMLTVMIHGFIFTQMEEPGYMLSIACLIGLRWQDSQYQKVE